MRAWPQLGHELGARCPGTGQIASLEGRGRGLYDGGGSQAATSHGDAMTSSANNSNDPAAASGRRSPRMADDDRKRKSEQGPGTAVITKTKPQTKKPSMYRVLILNDDY